MSFAFQCTNVGCTLQCMCSKFQCANVGCTWYASTVSMQHTRCSSSRFCCDNAAKRCCRPNRALCMRAVFFLQHSARRPKSLPLATRSFCESMLFARLQALAVEMRQAARDENNGNNRTYTWRDPNRYCQTSFNAVVLNRRSADLCRSA